MSHEDRPSKNSAALLAPKQSIVRPLDSNGKSTCGQERQNDENGSRRTYDRYRLQRHAARVLGWPKALSACEWARKAKTDNVQVWRNHSSERGAWTRFVGLQTCGSVWICPVCSNRRAWCRREDLQRLVQYAQAEDMTLVMLTLTSQHDLTTALSSQRGMMKKAKAAMVGLAAFKRGLGSHMVGSVTATEVTHGERSGWHLHFHYILMLDLRHLPAEEREESGRLMGEAAWPAWQGAAVRAGLHATRAAYSVEVGERVADYPGSTDKIDGWTLADEATRGAVKRGAGRHPFELLRLSCDENDERSRALFIEYATAMKGVAALMWSRGLADLVGVGAEDNEAHNSEVDEIVRERTGDLEEPDWLGRNGRKGVRARRGRMSIAVARDGTPGLERERDNDKADPTAAELDDAMGSGDLIDDDPWLDLDPSSAKVTDQDNRCGCGQNDLTDHLDFVRSNGHADVSLKVGLFQHGPIGLLPLSRASLVTSQGPKYVGDAEQGVQSWASLSSQGEEAPCKGEIRRLWGGA